MANRIQSELKAKAYISALRQRFSNPCAIFSERVTGIAIGPFFSVAYYSPYEWNRKITSECNRAMGWVKAVDGKAQVHFVYGKGQFSLFWPLFYTALFRLVLWFPSSWGYPLDILISAGLSLLLCGGTALHDSLTDAGAEGKDVLTSLLEEPDQFYYC